MRRKGKCHYQRYDYGEREFQQTVEKSDLCFRVVTILALARIEYKFVDPTTRTQL